MVIDNKKVTIRTENQSEYEEVNEIIYEAFAEQHGIETGKFMMEQSLGKWRSMKQTLLQKLAKTHN